MNKINNQMIAYILIVLFGASLFYRLFSDFLKEPNICYHEVIFEPIEEVDQEIEVLEVTYDIPVYLDKEYPVEYYVKYIEDEVPKKSYTDRELDLLSRLAHAEAETEGLDGMRRVVDVVLNRVDDDRFPNSIEDVIFAEGQFMTAEKLNKTRKTKVSTVAATTELKADHNDRLEQQSLYFARSPVTHKGLHQVGRHYFSY